ncbi:hypothetical protein [Nocardia brasiliensis]|uniref:hypothetical protein n=1 Tax=Nocardia brasiliensis TaxID=37326 RepID=UPI003671A0C0
MNRNDLGSRLAALAGAAVVASGAAALAPAVANAAEGEVTITFEGPSSDKKTTKKYSPTANPKCIEIDFHEAETYPRKIANETDKTVKYDTFYGRCNEDGKTLRDDENAKTVAPGATAEIEPEELMYGFAFVVPGKSKS